MRYTVIVASSARDLSQQVQDYLNNGWVLEGPMRLVANTQLSGYYLAQALVKPG